VPKYVLTGFSAGSFGAQWQITPSDRDIAVDVIDELENRRILWELSPREQSDRCAASASYMRQFLGTLMRTQGIGKELKMELKTIQAHFRQFMTNLSAYDLDRRGPVDPQSLERVLGWLREPVGQQVGLLAAQYGIEVSDNLSKIVPNQNDWFFEQI
jgi:hypothetical protein